ncbi:hypothetical protein RRF57_003903 [Xylaria bambusicola]|uniref:HD domain-containing protein n=1 Tax=Xylaria bambusicola TaxID=326684 RepID=A0AAN7UIB9_9PEZI
MKAAVLLSLVTAAAAGGCKNWNYPTTTIAGIEVVDTQIVRDALSLIKNSGLKDYVVKHQIRSWLFGAQQLNNNATLKSIVDPQAQAITILLHDLGWDQSADSPWTTKDLRFEVDSANGMRNFVRNHPDGKQISERKLQQMWDAIALQGAYGLASQKEPLVWGSINGIANDYEDPVSSASTRPSTTRSSRSSLLSHRPCILSTQILFLTLSVTISNSTDLLTGTNETFKWFCETKPETTYDTWVEGWGTYFVEGYDATGHRQVDQFRTVF